MKRGRQAASPPLVISARTRTLRAARWELLRSGLLIAPPTAPARGDTASPTPLHEAGGTGGTAPRSAASHPSTGTHRGGSFAWNFLGQNCAQLAGPGTRSCPRTAAWNSQRGVGTPCGAGTPQPLRSLLTPWVPRGEPPGTQTSTLVARTVLGPPPRDPPVPIAGQGPPHLAVLTGHRQPGQGPGLGHG